MLPVMTLRTASLQPGLAIPLNVGRPVSVAAVRAAVDSHDGEIVLLAQRDPANEDPGPDDLHGTGVLAKVLRVVPIPGGVQVAFQGLAVVRVQGLELGPDHWRAVPIATSGDADPRSVEKLRACMVEVARYDALPPEVVEGILAVSDAAILAGLGTFNLLNELGVAGLQSMLDLDLDERIDSLAALWEASAAKRRTSGPAPVPRPAPPAPEDDLGYMPVDEPGAVQWASTLVSRRGSVSLEELQNGVAGLTEPETEDVGALWRTIRQVTPGVFAARLAEQAHWPQVTPTDALLSTLEAMAEEGFLVRVGIDIDLGEAALAVEDAWTASTRGAVALTEEAMDRAAIGAGVDLGFMSLSDAIRSADVAVALVDRLRAAGLPVWWPGKEGIAVHVPIRWQRRLPSGPAV